VTGASGPQARRRLIAGNWKLYKTIKESTELAQALVQSAGAADSNIEIAIAPVFTALSKVAEVLAGSPIGLAAQDVFWEPQGAFTGEVGPVQLVDVGCRYVIVGHSERRQLFGETDEAVGRKAKALLAHGLAPIVCVGETLSEREAGQAENVVVRQLRAAVNGLTPAEVARLVIAYEPVWAIGTGKTAQPSDAQEMHGRIRATLAETFGAPLAQQLRVLYGGSVKPDNAATLMSQPDIDGALVGGASLTLEAFSAIIASVK
jgi:triosephosphate isomerase